MALIYSYKEKSSLTGSELLIGSDMNQYKNPSVSIKLLSVKDYVADAILQGDSPYVPVFDAATDTLSNSIIQQNSNNPIDGISIGGAIDAVTNIAASGNITLQGNLIGQGNISGVNITATTAVAGSTLQSTLNTTVGGDLIVSGDANVTTDVNVTGDVNALNVVATNNITGSNNIDIGGTNSVTGSRSGTIGNKNSVAGDDAFSAGHSAHSLGNDSVSLGHGTSAAGHGSLAAGFYASAGNEGVASCTADVTSNVFVVDNLIGTLTTGMYVYPFNLDERREITNVVDNGNGTYSITVAGGSVTVYNNARVYFESDAPDRNDQYGTIAIGNEATSIGNNAVSIGYRAQSTSANEIVIGSSIAPTTIAGDLNTVNIAVGENNNVTGDRAGTVGRNNAVAGDDSFSAGHDSHALGEASVSLGHSTSAAGHGSLAAGFSASAGNEGVASLTATGSGNTFTVDKLVGTLTSGMYAYPFGVGERREITNVVDNGDTTYDITIAGSAVQYYDNTRIFFESATPDRGDQYGTVAIGNEATAIGNNAIAIGHLAQSTTASEVVIGSSVADTVIGGNLNIVGSVTGTSFAEITSGTWTPTLGTNPGGSIVYTYTTQTGNWYAIGDIVVANFQIIGTAQGVSSSDIVTISAPHDPAYDEPGGTVYDAGTGFSVKPIGFGRSFSSAHAGASILGTNGEILTAAEVNFAQTFNLLGQLIYKK